jgi:hypothetical protein
MYIKITAHDSGFHRESSAQRECITMDQSQFSKIEAMPELLSTNDLKSLGLYRSLNATYLARRHGHSPDYIKVGRKIFYPKAGVINFIQSRL